MDRDFQTTTLEDFEQDHDLGALCLSDLLSQGELILMLGAGVSAPTGLPSWSEIVANCEAAVGMPLHAGSDRPGDELMRVMDDVYRTLGGPSDAGARQRYFGVVRSALYTDEMLRQGEYPDSIIQERLLISLGALVMASARGSVADVFTFNFDDLLEWYLHLHGFVTQVVSHFPTELRGDADVTVFHVHGFVPLLETLHEASEGIVFTHSELVERLAGGFDEPWPILVSSRLLAKRFLAVGTSMQDMDLDLLLARAQKSVGSELPLGFSVDVDIPQRRCAELKERGVVPISLDSYEDVPSFLLGICRRSAIGRS